MLHSLIAPLALNTGFDHVLIVAADGNTLLDLHQPGVAAGPASTAEIAPADLIREIRGLAEHSVKEVVLLGQTVNAYRYDDTDFGALLKMIARIDGIERISFTSPHPSDVTGSLINAMATRA